MKLKIAVIRDSYKANMVTIDIEDKVINIEDIGVTLRTLLAVAATGYEQTNTRKWNIRYKNTIIGKIHVATKRKSETPQANLVIGPLDKNILIDNVQVNSNWKPGSLQASLVLAGLV